MADLTAELSALAREIAGITAALAAVEARQLELARLVGAQVQVTPPAAPAPAPMVQSPAPAAAQSAPDQELTQRLEQLAHDLDEKGIGVDPADAGFLTKAGAVLAKAGDERARRLIDILTFCDRLGAFYIGACYRPLQDGLATIRPLVQRCLGKSWRLVQKDGVEPDAPGPRLPIAGSLVLATGVVDETGIAVQEAAAIHPLSGPTPMASAAWGLVEELFARLMAGFSKTLKNDLIHARQQAEALISAPDPEGLRLLLNGHTRWVERADTPAAKAALVLLREQRNLRPAIIALGERFDPDRHAHKLYDRIARAESGAPSGQVVGIRQIGLIDASGLPVQKCIAITSQ